MEAWFLLNALAPLLVTTLCLLVYFSIPKRKNGFPPGPVACPLLGNMPHLGRDAREGLRQLSLKYGELYSVFLGTRAVVVLASNDVMREALCKHAQAFAGRDAQMFKRFSKGYGLAGTNGTFHHNQRKYANKVFKDFGIFDKLFQTKVLEEVDDCVKTIRKNLNSPFDLKGQLETSITNVISSVSFGQRYRNDDEELHRLKKLIKRAGELFANTGMMTAFPWLEHLPGDLFQFGTFEAIMDELRSILQQHILRHERSLHEGTTPRDILDMYLIGGKELTAEGKENFLSGPNLSQVILEMYAAGTDTTTASLAWAFLFMLHHPEVQGKIQKELDDVIGRDSVPIMDDREYLPYTNACIHEAQRLACVAPLGVFHTTTEDVELRGYSIPRGTLVMPFHYALDRDADVWEKPYELYPEHFLDEDGAFRKRREHIPFSLGKRSCMGEPLARMELFLFFTTLLQNFTFSVDGEVAPDTEGILGITYRPKAFKLIVTERK